MKIIKNNTTGMKSKDISGAMLDKNSFNSLLNEIKNGTAKGNYKYTNYIYYLDNGVLIKFDLKRKIAFALSPDNMWIVKQQLGELLTNDLNALPRKYDVFEDYPMEDIDLRQGR